jgi:uncharacterized membrane protein YcaP (DUF421 family)
MAIVALRTVVIYTVLVAAMRVMGKRQLGDLNPSELVVTLLIADMAAVAMEDTGAPLFSGLIPIAVLVSLELLLSGAMLKLPFVERLMSGRAVWLIVNGELDCKAMKKLRLTLDDVMSALRQQGVFNLQDVQYAVAETGGQISVSLQPTARPVTPADLSLAPPDNTTPFLVVNDGKPLLLGLSLSEHDLQWLHRILREKHCTLEDVFLMTADRGGNVHLIRKKESVSNVC